jgi:hypothetical protein
MQTVKHLTRLPQKKGSADAMKLGDTNLTCTNTMV